jgi:ABC-2 type transport system ATP-binding protein
MIRVEHLTKRFGPKTAVDDISFRVQRGEIVGFLGPNGAGKTTTMRMLSGFMPATGGRVEIAGYDVFRDSLEVRRRIGYLPEHVPLYPEMRVCEYLAYRGRLKGVRGGRLRKAVGEVLECCGLLDVRRTLIGRLSKGYRQRVGLADSLVHKPDLLLLDEPTIGLDPNQIRHIRHLIKGLGGAHTVMLSSHILPEIETICERVLIINRGRIVASDTPENLIGVLRGNVRVVAEMKGSGPVIKAALEQVPGVVRVTCSSRGDWNHFYCECERTADVRDAIFELAVARQWPLRELRMDQARLEDVFVAITAGYSLEALQAQSALNDA